MLLAQSPISLMPRCPAERRDALWALRGYLQQHYHIYQFRASGAVRISKNESTLDEFAYAQAHTHNLFDVARAPFFSKERERENKDKLRLIIFQARLSVCGRYSNVCASFF